MKPIFQNEFGEVAANEALKAGAEVCETWQLRLRPRGAIVVTRSTLGWWGVYRNGEQGRLARRQSLTAAVRFAANA